MELTQLYYFRTVARMEHFTRAAEELHITQPTLSKTISRLEGELGVKLFDREGSHVRLNIYGQAFLKQVDGVFLCLTEGKHQIADLQDSETGEIHIAATVPESLSPFIRSYLLEHPGIHLHQIQATAEEMGKLLEQRKIDFAVSLQPIPSLNVEWIPLMKEELGLFVSVDNPLSQQTSVALSAARNERFIMHNSNEDLRLPFLNYCHQAGFEPNIYFEGDQPDLIGDLVANNFGISYGSKNRHEYHHSRAGIQNFRIKFVGISDMDCYRITGVGVLRNRTLSSAANALLKYLMTNYRPRPAESIP